MRKLQIQSVLIVITLLIACCPAFAQSKAAVMQGLKDYFQAFKSIKVSSVLVLKQDKLHPALERTSVSMKFWMEGDKYRSESKNPSIVKDVKATTNAYNGMEYQTLEVLEGGAKLQKSKSDSLHGLNPYGGANPLLWISQFAFGKGDVQTIETLQLPRTWTYLSKRTSKIEKTTRNGRPGFQLTVNVFGQATNQNYVVFIDGTTFLPMHVRKVTKQISGSEISEFTVVKTKIWKNGGKTLLFPTRIEMKQIENNATIQLAYIDVDPKSLNINSPIADEIFTIPLSQATVVVDDEDRKDVQKKPDAEKKSKM